MLQNSNGTTLSLNGPYCEDCMGVAFDPMWITRGHISKMHFFPLIQLGTAALLLLPTWQQGISFIIQIQLPSTAAISELSQKWRKSTLLFKVHMHLSACNFSTKLMDFTNSMGLKGSTIKYFTTCKGNSRHEDHL